MIDNETFIFQLGVLLETVADNLAIEIEMQGMIAENKQREHLDESMAYGAESFEKLKKNISMPPRF